MKSVVALTDRCAPPEPFVKTLLADYGVTTVEALVLEMAGRIERLKGVTPSAIRRTAVIVGEASIAKLRAKQEVELKSLGVTLIPADDLMNASPWIPVTERLPEGHGEVLVAHPCLSNIASQMFGVAVRAESTVRKWMSDPSDDSMHNAFWMPMPKGPA